VASHRRGNRWHRTQGAIGGIAPKGQSVASHRRGNRCAKGRDAATCSEQSRRLGRWTHLATEPRSPMRPNSFSHSAEHSADRAPPAEGRRQSAASAAMLLIAHRSNFSSSLRHFSIVKFGLNARPACGRIERRKRGRVRSGANVGESVPAQTRAIQSRRRCGESRRRRGQRSPVRQSSSMPMSPEWSMS
jgi:hypothetical protein